MVSGTPSKSDSLFPSTSIGRAHGSRSVSRTGSFETLSAHPLLSPTPTSPTTSVSGSSEIAVGSSSSQRYVPYTPRHRVATTSATTGTTVHPSVSVPPPQHQGLATSKLQLQNLKGHVGLMGVDTGSLGWAMLEKLVGEGDQAPEWNEIWNAITFGKATLLLPLEQVSPQHVITSDFLKDHVAFCNGSSQNNASLVTLSGLRGNLNDGTLTIRSSLPLSSKTFQALQSPSTRSSTLSALSPLPIPLTSTAASAYPSFSVSSRSESLPMPPRASGIIKPALPPRPNASASSALSSSRIPNPFASLFAKAPVPPTLMQPPSHNKSDGDHVFEVSAFTIDRRVVRKDVTKTISKAIKAEIKESLHGAPSWVAQRVYKFSSTLQPFSRESKKASNSETTTTPSIDVMLKSPDEVSQSVQDFYASLEEDLRANGSPVIGRRREDRTSEDEKEKERRATESAVQSREILEKVERTLCSVFYDRIFRPVTSDDASHDEALSSRVAALNMLDLGLEHLGVDAGTAGLDLQRVVLACGETLSKLDTCRSPADKAAILVATHKRVVDGLSRLPPIRLKSEAEIDSEKTPMASSFGPIQRRTVNGDRAFSPMEGTEEPDSTEASSSTSSAVTTNTSSEASPEPNPSLQLSDTAIALTTHDVEPEPPSITPPIDADTLSPPRAASPLLSATPPPDPTPVSADVILPLIIFSVVKSNPHQLVSHLLYTQRYRNHSVGGEESYSLVNLMAVAEFLENVDLEVLGLGDSENKVMSTADLTPIPLSHGVVNEQQGIPARLRGRVEQQVDALADSATKVISGVTGVVDSSFGVLRALLPSTPGLGTPGGEIQDMAPWNVVRPGFGLLRRESGFSIANFAASLPGARKPRGEESGQQMVEVNSRPGSIKSFLKGEVGEEESEEGEDESDEQNEEEAGIEEETEVHDTRSIRSFESMMSSRERERKGRKSLTDRFATMSGLTRLSHPSAQDQRDLPSSRQPSLPVPTGSAPTRFDTPISSRAASPAPALPSSPVTMRIAPPKGRYLECAPEDLRLSEVAELLVEYRRLVDAVRAQGGFEES